jgi:hypothetical protein
VQACAAQLKFLPMLNRCESADPVAAEQLSATLEYEPS